MQIVLGLGLFGGAVLLFCLLAGTAAAMSRPRWIPGSPVSYRPTAIATIMAAMALMVVVAVGTTVFLDVAAAVDVRLWLVTPGPAKIVGGIIGACMSVTVATMSALWLSPKLYDWLLGPRERDRVPIAFITSRRRGFNVP